LYIRVGRAIVVDLSAAMHPLFGAFVAKSTAPSARVAVVVPPAVVGTVTSRRHLVEAAGNCGDFLKALTAAEAHLRQLRGRAGRLAGRLPEQSASGSLRQAVVEAVETLADSAEVILLSQDATTRQEADARLVERVRSGYRVRPAYFGWLTAKSATGGTQGHIRFEPARIHAEPRPGMLGRLGRRLGRRLPPPPSVPPIDLEPGATVFEVGRRDREYVLCRELGNGGEGAVFEVGTPDGPRACKIHHAAVPAEAAKRKVQAMLAACPPPPRCAWPDRLVMDDAGRYRGFLMPLAPGRPLADLLADPDELLAESPGWTRRHWVDVLLDLLGVVADLSARRYRMGDLKPENVMVDGTSVRLVDCDSLEFDGFPCPVWDDRFLSPRLARLLAGDRRPARTDADDQFALAVLVFLTLMGGTHPYSHRGCGPVRQNIVAGVFPYREDGRPTGREPEGDPPGLPARLWSHLQRPVREAFARAFDLATRWAPDACPTAERWAALLTDYRAILDDPDRSFDSRRQVYDRSILPTHPKLYN
jgi:hypothetical protein